MLLTAVSSINLSKDKFKFVPLQDFSRPWTDADLYAKYNLTEDEIAYIEQLISQWNSHIHPERILKASRTNLK